MFTTRTLLRGLLLLCGLFSGTIIFAAHWSIGSFSPEEPLFVSALVCTIFLALGGWFLRDKDPLVAIIASMAFVILVLMGFGVPMYSK
jgi:hypothetical protein